MLLEGSPGPYQTNPAAIKEPATSTRSHRIVRRAVYLAACFITHLPNPPYHCFAALRIAPFCRLIRDPPGLSPSQATRPGLLVLHLDTVEPLLARARPRRPRLRVRVGHPPGLRVAEIASPALLGLAVRAAVPGPARPRPVAPYFLGVAYPPGLPVAPGARPGR